MARPGRIAGGSRRRSAILAVGLAALIGTPPRSGLGAGLPDTPVGGPEIRALLNQKQMRVAQLVSNSPLATRIDASDDGAAKGYLAAAREALARAQAALAGGNLALADQEFNAAIISIRAARQRIPPPAAELELARARHAHLLASVQALRAGYAGLLVGGGSPGPAGAEDTRVRPAREATSLIAAAQDLARGERYTEAGERLRQAQAILLAAYRQNLSEPTMVYPRHFADPVAQFDHELARFHGYHALVPVAIEKLRPAAKNRSAIEGEVSNATRLEARAREQAARGDWKAGLASLDGATAALERALAIAGVSVPAAGREGAAGQ